LKALVAGWFSFEDGHATAGDLLARDLVCEWLERAGYSYDIAVASPFSGGVSLHRADPSEYALAVFVCGPFEKKALEAEFLGRFARCFLVGINLSIPVSLAEWNPFDFLIERDSSVRAHPDIVFLSERRLMPVVGRCLVEPYDGAVDAMANAAFDRLTASREMAVVPVDTRLDANSTGLRSPGEIETLLARMDVVITTRLHGMVLALKNGVPVIAIDPEPGGAKIMRQAETIGWPFAYAADAVNDQLLQQVFEYCLTDDARLEARRCRERAVTTARGARQEFIAALSRVKHRDPKHLERKALAQSFGWDRSVAVVITTYNHANFLSDAIASVLAQTRPADEIIVIDDGSTDEPGAVVTRYPEVRFIHQTHQGLAAARNTGLRAASSEAIVFLDADDRLLANALAEGVACLAREPRSGLVYGGHRRTDANWRPIGENYYEPVSDPYVDLLQGNLIGMHATVMYCRERLEQIGGFDPSLRRCEDYDAYLRMAKIHPISSHPNTIAEYRFHEANMSTDHREMLRWALKVHGRQKYFAFAHPCASKAWRRGRSIWREYYSEQRLLRARETWSRPGNRLYAFRELLDAALMSPWPPMRAMIRSARRHLRDLLPSTIVQRIRQIRSGQPAPPFGKVRFGDLGGSVPIDDDFGFGRGTPIDRGYIAEFLSRHAEDIGGRVLEVGDDDYSRRFGGARITRQDIFHVNLDNPRATIVGDLAKPGVLPPAAFDCLVLTQTLHLVYDMASAVRQMHRALRPKGVVLLTVPGISRIDRGEWRESWCWSLTEASARRMFSDVFGTDQVEVETHGNVFAAVAFLHGLALEEVSPAKLNVRDPAFPVIVSVRAQKSAEA
jgi:glycosyltransferase involved in cell wall biosynthesis/SAM-dependent methyltransferase